MTKKDELDDQGSCLNKAALDEPLFVLLAQDRVAPSIIEVWADMVELLQGVVSPKTAAARAQASRMRAWQAVHQAKVPD